MNDPSKWNEEYTLTADVDLTGKAQIPIGTYTKPFSGHFNGNGHTVTVQIVGTECAGLFGVTENALIENLTVCGEIRNAFAATNAETKTNGEYSATGGIVGLAKSGTSVRNCTNKANVFGPCNLGGVVGIAYNYSSTPVEISDCVNEGIPSATYGNMGGVLGRVQIQATAYPAVILRDCSNTANMTYTSEDRGRFGGILGYARITGGVVLVENCKNSGKLNGSNANKTESNFPNVGGIVGRAEVVSKANSALQITGCYNIGTIDSSKFAGGIVGYFLRDKVCTEYSSFVIDSVNTAVITGGTYAGGIVGYTQNTYAGETNLSYVRNCLNTASVSAGTVGGILGRLQGRTAYSFLQQSAPAQIRAVLPVPAQVRSSAPSKIVFMQTSTCVQSVLA